jgi:hypothetical protein
MPAGRWRSSRGARRRRRSIDAPARTRHLALRRTKREEIGTLYGSPTSSRTRERRLRGRADEVRSLADRLVARAEDTDWVSSPRTTSAVRSREDRRPSSLTRRGSTTRRRSCAGTRRRSASCLRAHRPVRAGAVEWFESTERQVRSLPTRRGTSSAGRRRGDPCGAVDRLGVAAGDPAATGDKQWLDVGDYSDGRGSGCDRRDADAACGAPTAPDPAGMRPGVPALRTGDPAGAGGRGAVRDQPTPRRGLSHRPDLRREHAHAARRPRRERRERAVRVNLDVLVDPEVAVRVRASTRAATSCRCTPSRERSAPRSCGSRRICSSSHSSTLRRSEAS